MELQSSRTTNGTLTDIPTRELLKECKSGKLFLWSYRGMSESLADEELLGLVAITQNTVVSDLHEAFGQDVKQKPTDKLFRRHSHDLPFVIVLVIPPFEADFSVLHGQDAVVGDGNAVRISTKVFHNAGGIFKGRLAVDDPFLGIAGIK